MEQLEKVLETVTEEERLEIVHLMWLYDHAPESAKVKAVTRIDRELARGKIEPHLLMAAVREVADDLRGLVEKS